MPTPSHSIHCAPLCVPVSLWLTELANSCPPGLPPPSTHPPQAIHDTTSRPSLTLLSLPLSHPPYPLTPHTLTPRSSQVSILTTPTRRSRLPLTCWQLLHQVRGSWRLCARWRLWVAVLQRRGSDSMFLPVVSGLRPAFGHSTFPTKTEPAKKEETIMAAR